MRTIRLLAVALVAIAWGVDFQYRAALPGYRYSFPRDHFEHPDFRTEWWYYTGNLHSSDGKRFGFELIFFRQGQRRGEPIENRSAWRIDDAYLAHLALTDIDGKRFYPDERLNRAGPCVLAQASRSGACGMETGPRSGAGTARRSKPPARSFDSIFGSSPPNRWSSMDRTA